MFAYDLNQDPGEGNLNARAYLASLVGPRRVAHGRRSVKLVPLLNVINLGNQPKGVEVTYFEVWIPQTTITALPGGGAYLSFSSNETAGQNGYQLLMNAGQRYQGILLPDDKIYAQAISDALGAPLAADVPVVVASVVF